ncbi:uncharacterized protein RAG0_00371 [Rhynchosporium agropyri]|uniref:Uncharacterized protein n=1 Tax=Rhynchosporium agropyri TaxID=914238 RepID=A0A1E1JS63_9HELO|nr:uncharacterized protein RAG0_00371 [Rhynchosporium agropyri]
MIGFVLCGDFVLLIDLYSPIKPQLTTITGNEVGMPHQVQLRVLMLVEFEYSRNTWTTKTLLIKIWDYPKYMRLLRKLRVLALLCDHMMPGSQGTRFAECRGEM